MTEQEKALKTTDAIEHATLTRLAEIYAGALKTALKDKKAFLQTLKDVDSGKIQPPQYYVDRDEVDKWRRGFVTQLVRKNAIIDGIANELNKAGVQAADLIRGEMTQVYQTNRDAVASDISVAVEGLQATTPAFAVLDRKQIEILVREGQSPFSEVAYEKLGKNPAARRRLQYELGQAVLLGETQDKLIKRIRKVTGQSYKQAKRVAQTERTRVQSQARWETGQEAVQMGINLAYRWSARMVNTRETHAALNGTIKPADEPFVTIVDGHTHTLRYPGDPEAPASEVINCHCVLVPVVLLPGEEVPK